MAAITSEKNPRVQQVIRLREKSRERKKENLFVIEGVRELELALKGGYIIKEIFYCTQSIKGDLAALKKRAGGTEWIEISSKVYQKIAVRESTEGLMAVGAMRELNLGKIKLSANPLLLVAEGVEKPGNLGALLRTADAACVDAMLVCDAMADIYSPNVIRASLGCLFTQQVVCCTSEEAVSWLKKNNIVIFSATPRGTVSYFQADFKRPSAIVVGSEAQGLSSSWLKNSDEEISIPMRGAIDSLNVSVSAAVILFEAVRQRGKR